MPNTGGMTTDGLTRRETLKRGAALGGALLWATPVVQSIGMSAAYAMDTSDGCVTYCIKYEFTGADDEPIGTWSELGQGTGNCFVCPTDAENGPLPAGFFDDFEVYIETNQSRKTRVYVRYPETCSLAETDSTPDELVPDGNAVAAKCGSSSCNYQRPEEVHVGGGLKEIVVLACDPPDGLAISHIELIIRCCP